MGIRRFHLFFISVSVVLMAFVVAWAVGQYRLESQVQYLVAGIVSAGAGAALAVYGAAFQRKTRNL